MIQHLRFDRVDLSKKLSWHLKNDGTFILSCPSSIFSGETMGDFVAHGPPILGWGMPALVSMVRYVLNETFYFWTDLWWYFWIIGFSVVPCCSTIFWCEKLYWFYKVFPQESKCHNFQQKLRDFVTPPALCNLRSNLPPLHRPPPPLPTSPIARWRFGKGFDRFRVLKWRSPCNYLSTSTGTSANPIFNMYIYIYFCTNYCETWRLSCIALWYLSFPFHACLPCLFLFFHVLLLTIQYLHTYTTCRFFPHSPPQVMCSFWVITLLKTNTFPPKGTIEDHFPFLKVGYVGSTPTQ